MSGPDGHSVTAVDVNPKKVGAIARGISQVTESGLGELVAATVAAGTLKATTSAAEAVARSDLSLICVGTPSRLDGGIDPHRRRGLARKCRRPDGKSAITLWPPVRLWCRPRLQQLCCLHSRQPWLRPPPAPSAAASIPSSCAKGSGIED